MKQIAVLHLNHQETTETVTFMGQSLQIRHLSCDNDLEKAKAFIAELDGDVDAIALHGMPAELKLGPAKRDHAQGAALTAVAQQTPVVDGRIVRPGLERWGMILADRAQPGIFSRKRVLMVPGLNHNGMARAFERHGGSIRYADPFIYFNLPKVPGIGLRQTRNQAAPFTLDRLKEVSFAELYPMGNGRSPESNQAPFDWADVIAGDIGTIRQFAPKTLKRKTIVVESASQADLDDLQARGVDIVVTLMPALDEDAGLGQWSAAAVEAALTALRLDTNAPLNEDTYLDMMANLEWTPAIRTLQPENVDINRFAFVIHPLNVGFIHNHRAFRWTKYLPDSIVEAVAAYIPPLTISRITGGQSPTTGQRTPTQKNGKD